MCTGHFKEIGITGFLLGPKAHPSCGKTSRILDDERRKSALNKTFQKRGRKTIIIHSQSQLWSNARRMVCRLPKTHFYRPIAFVYDDE